jgi:hypothetical protein
VTYKVSKRIGAMLLLVVLLASLQAYTISPKSDVHESMTRASKRCFDIAARDGAKPVKCDLTLLADDSVEVWWLTDSSIRFYDAIGWFKRVLGVTARVPTLVEAVRWPDDPTRQLGAAGLAKWLGNMLGGCARVAADAGRDSTINSIDDGLLCNSHYGEMQFFHAQATRRGERAVETHDKIRRWGEFLFRVSSSRHLSDQDLDEAYCKVFSPRDAFNSAMLPRPQSIPCEDQKDPAWKLTTLFTMKCANPITSVGCGEEVRSSRHVKARVYATGALLHLIQDSYSQSHCERGWCGVKPGDRTIVAKVECVPVTRFTAYRGQTRHDEADKVPVFEESCRGDTGVDDPITAGAKVLWHIQNRSDVDLFLEDLDKVFGTPAQIERIGKPADFGECFGDPQIQ